jgi:exopolysaccharide production protein ExoQ
VADPAGARPEQPAAREGLSFRKRRPVGVASAQIPNRIVLVEYAFVIFSVAVFLGISTLGRTAAAEAVGATEHNTLNTILYCSVLGISGALLLIYRREVVPVLGTSKMLWLFMAWAVASVAWSVDPDLAVRRLIQFFAPLLLALYAAARFDPATTIRLAGWAYFSTIVASAIVAVLLPRVGVMHDSAAALKWADLAEGARLEGDWSGILGHKNVLGFATIANAQIFAWRWYVEKDRRWLHGAIVLFGMFVTYKTHSATSALLVCLTLATYIIIHVTRRAARLRALIFFSVIVVGAIGVAAAVSLPEQFTALVGKDATLTGRVPIWTVLMKYTIPGNPILGYGFNTYFILNNPDYLRLVDIVGWPAPHAHNGYLNLAVELGLPGAVLGTCILLRLIAGSLHRVNDPGAPWVLHVLVFGVTFAVLNIVESSLLRISDNWAFALTFCCFALWKYQADARPKAQLAPRHWGEMASRAPPGKHTELP